MDERIHKQAIERHRHYASRGVKPLPKWFRYRATMPAVKADPVVIRDEHAAVLVRRSLDIRRVA